MIKIYLVSLMYFIIHSSSFTQTSSSFLSRIGDTYITTDDFKYRFEFSPRITSNRNIDTLKKEFLHNLIAEKLWALEAKNLRYDTSDYVKYSTSILEKLYVRDALYKIEVTDKSVILKDEIQEGIKRINSTLKVNFIRSDSEKEINSLYVQLQSGAAFDSLLKQRVENIEQQDSITIEYGQVEKRVEDILYGLAPGDFSAPTLTDAGWVIFYLKNRLRNIGSDPQTKDKVYRQVEKIVEKRVAQRAYDEFHNKFFKGVLINADINLFKSLSNKLWEKLSEIEKVNPAVEGERIYLGDNNILAIEKSYNFDSLNLPFIKFKKDPITLKEFLKFLEFDKFSVSSIEYKNVANTLNSMVKNYIKMELLSREGYKRGLDKLPDVLNAVNMWRDSYLASVLRHEYIDSAKISDSVAYRNFLEKRENYNTVTCKIIEFTTDSLELIELVLNEINAGKDFHELIVKYSDKSPDSLESGYFSITERGEIGRIAAEMEIGEIYGPIKVPTGYSVFELVDKKDKSEKIINSFEEEKDRIKREMFSSSFKNKILEKTIELANKYKIELNNTLLNSIRVTEVNMVVFKYFGFGGKLLAVPLTQPFYNWFEEWKSRRTSLP